MKKLLICALWVYSLSAQYIANLETQFYQPKFLSVEPRFAKDWFSSFDFIISRGSASKAWNHHQHLVPLFDIFGIQKIPFCTEQGCIPLSFSFDAHFKITQLQMSLIQNFINGFFVTGWLPIKRAAVTSIDIIPLNKSDTSSHPAPIPILDQFLKKEGLSRQSVRPTGLGDLLITIGNTHSILEDPYFDFIDMSLQMGILLPTSKEKNESEIFSIPLGFDGHWAGVIAVDMALGAYEWITVGAHFDIFAFIPHKKCIRIKSDSLENGIIFGTAKKVKLNKAPQFSASVYGKADHVSRGLSITAGYSFTYQGNTKLKGINSTLPSFVNTDRRFESWFCHTIHALLEYDFTTAFDTVGPRISLFYDRPVSGKNVFLTTLWSGGAGIDISWNF